MAAIRLPRPGTELGPCAEPCSHTDCAASRAMAESVCRYCGEPISYGRMFYDAESGPGYVHATCVEEPVERGPEPEHLASEDEIWDAAREALLRCAPAPGRGWFGPEGRD